MSEKWGLYEGGSFFMAEKVVPDDGSVQTGTVL
jgi:hypothetical protein